MTRVNTFAVCVVTSLLIPLLRSSSVAAQNCDPEGHLDIGLEVHDGRIETGVYNLNDPLNPTVLETGVRVWGGRFQVNPLDPFFSDDPGFGAVTGSGPPAGSQIGFNVLADLLYWDGTGAIQFGPVPASERLRIRFGFQNRYVGTGTGFLSGFNFETVASGGEVHRHLSFFLLGADGNATPASQDGVQATDGIYLLQIEVTNTGGISPSEPLYVVFNNGLKGCLHCVALNHTGMHLARDRSYGDLDFDRDVDTTDLDAFIACATGPTVPWTDPCCQAADLDLDGDIDQTDFALLQRGKTMSE